MSIQDIKLQLSDNQAITAATSGSDVVSTYHIDIGAAESIGPGTPLYLNILVGTAITFGTSSGDDDGCRFRLQSHTDSGFSSQVNLITKQLTRANLTAGKYAVRQSIPYEQSQRFLRLEYHNIADTAFGTGKVDAWISLAMPDTDVGT